MEKGWKDNSWKVKSKLIDFTNITGHLLPARHFSGLRKELAFYGVRLTGNKPKNECNVMSGVRRRISDRKENKTELGGRGGRC